MNSIGGRKLFAVLCCGAACTALCYLGKIDGEWYVEAIKWSVTPFIVGSAFEKIVPLFSRK